MTTSPLAPRSDVLPLTRRRPALDLGTAQGAAVVVGESVLVVGEIDLANVDVLRLALTKATRRSTGFTVDLTGVNYLDSAGLRVLREFVPAEPTLLVAEHSIVDRVLQIVGLPAVLRVHRLPLTA